MSTSFHRDSSSPIFLQLQLFLLHMNEFCSLPLSDSKVQQSRRGDDLLQSVVPDAHV